MFDRMAAGLTSAALGVIKFLLAVGFVIAVFVWMTNNPDDFQRVAGSVLSAAGDVIVLAADWIGEQAASAAAG